MPIFEEIKMSRGSHVETPLAAKKITNDYKDGWNAIWGKKATSKTRVSNDSTESKEETGSEEIPVKKAASKVLRNKKNSKKEKVKRGEALSQRTHPAWGEPTVSME